MSSQNPIVSVIINFLNTADFLQEAIESVLSQTYEHWELLLVDDGSNDGSSEIARQFAYQFNSRILYFEHDGHQNLGTSASRNLGILHSKGAYIAFLDADDFWLPDKLETHVKILDMHSEAGMLFGSAKYWYSWTGRPDDIQRDYLPKRRIKVPTLFNPPLFLTLFLEGKTEVPHTCSVLVRTQLLKKIGGFEESFRGMYDDQALYAKICLCAPVFATGDCLALYRRHSKSQSLIANESGHILAMHYSFLKWLEAYCHSLNETDPRVLQAIRRQLWLYNNMSYGVFPHLSPNRMRWIKKWILRFEEHIIPAKIRDRLWSHG